MQSIRKIISLIDEAILSDPENSLKSGNIIKSSYDKNVYEYRQTISGAKDWLANYQSKLIGETWITNLKIKFTWVSGYFIEIPKSQTSKIWDSFIHKQTLANASRFITNILKEFEQKLMESENVLFEKEYEVFCDVRESILDNFESIKKLSKKTAFLDFWVSLAKVSYENNYFRPQIGKYYKLDIKSWKHPIIEKIEKDFISNDLYLDEKKFVHIITWPNMWGKSTFLRQNALIILMSHIWSFVPASSAKIPLTDKIFSRVWASDNLFLWQSTFMVEMQEIANILNNSTSKSFVIIDEIGRGTSTYDGMSLAWAILKHNHDEIKAKTLFATHYHELVDESKKLSCAESFSVAVWEYGDELIFLRKIITGSIGKSFWLEVAKLAWINKEVIKEARFFLSSLEKQASGISNNTSSLNIDLDKEKRRKEIFKIEEELKKIDTNNLTPMEALNKLSKLKKML